MLEGGDGILLADDVPPHVTGPPAPGLEPVHDEVVEAFGRSVPSTTRYRSGCPAAIDEEVLPDRVVEGVRLGLEPVVRVAAAPTALVGGDVDDDGEVGHQAIDGPHLQVVHLGRPEVAPGALVGDGGVGVAVGDDDLAAVEGGPDELVDVVRLVGGEEQRLGPGETWSPCSTRSRMARRARCRPAGG